MGIHAVAASGYAAGAAIYERGRPTYADDAFHAIADAGGRAEGRRRAVDVGAGTGKWTRGLAAIADDVIAVEPVAAMRSVLARQVPSADLVAGVAEALPLATGSADVVTVASAVHWFAVERAVPELCRVARPGGVLAVAANVRDRDVPWVAALDQLLDARRGGVPSGRTGAWRDTFVAAPLLEHLGEHRAPNPIEIDADGLAARVASLSYVAAMPAASRAELEVEVRALASQLPARFTMPYTTVVTLYRRRPEPWSERCP